jgi:hypothetical protein
MGKLLFAGFDAANMSEPMQAGDYARGNGSDNAGRIRLPA